MPREQEFSVRCESGPGGGPVGFAAPEHLIEAFSAAEVVPAFQAADAALKAGRWLAGFVSYEAGYALEPRLAPLMPGERRLPLLLLGVFRGPGHPQDLPATDAGLGPLTPLWDRARYGAAFAEAHRLIGAGDMYQVNLTLPLTARWHGRAEALYARLLARQRVGHGALVIAPGVALASLSPELFFRTEASGRILARPMKGTAPRLPEGSADLAQAEGLRRDPKNRAENLMITDLLRNDLGRICRIGSIRVPELFRVESYATVHQMVSSVEGTLMPGQGLGSIFAALFPCGSVTGAPKIRAMEVIRELEPRPREAYCGAIGWAGPDGSADFSVAIRTLHLYSGGAAVLNAGGGLVWDSRAGAEYEELLWKTRFADLSRRA
jgi:para-aminobenzoate synthetase component 1